jgi:two-component system response regulator HupR/HoxA
VPPLRERSADILPIADMLLARAAQELDRPQVRFAKDVQANLLAYAWPGNIRELKNEIYRAVALSDGKVVGASAFSQRVLYGQCGINIPSTNGKHALPQSGSLQERIDAMEAVILRETMLRLHWNKTHAAKELGLSRVGLRQKLARFGLEGHDDA